MVALIVFLSFLTLGVAFLALWAFDSPAWAALFTSWAFFGLASARLLQATRQHDALLSALGVKKTRPPERVNVDELREALRREGEPA